MKEVNEIKKISLNTLLFYKTKKCNNLNCNYSNDPYEINDSCYNFHSKKDKRRYPFKIQNNPENYENKIELNESLFEKIINNQNNEIKKNYFDFQYNEILIENFYEFISIITISKKDKMIINKKNSLNFFESNYHPLVYKKNICKHKNCQNEFCYNYHNDIEKIFYQKIRDFFDSDDNIFNNFFKKLENIQNKLFDIKIIPKNNLINNNKEIKEIKENKQLDIDMEKVKKKKVLNNKKFKVEEIRNNYNKCYKYFYNEILEFKEGKNNHILLDLELKPVINTICGLLNDKGGKIYIGATKEGVIKGLSLKRQQIDEFQINLDIMLRNFSPGVFPDLIKVNFYEVSTNEFYESVLINKFVIVIKVKNVFDFNQVYLTHENILCIYKNNKILLLQNTLSIIDYVKTKIIIYNESKNLLKNRNTNSVLSLINKIDDLLSN